MKFAFPRLSDGDALVILQEVRDLAGRSPDRLTELVSFEHPKAQPVPTGATVASVAHIEGVRSRVIPTVEKWLTGKPIPRSEVSVFDSALGAALYAALQILPADAAHQGTWNFLSAVVFPDLSWARFSELHENRFLGTPRNVLRRTWQRHEVLGDIQAAAAEPLGEDELVGLFERSSLARNHRLIRALAQKVLGTAVGNRSQYARDLYRHATDATGPLLLDILNDDEIREVVEAAAQGKSWSVTVKSSGSQTAAPSLSTEISQPSVLSDEPLTSDPLDVIGDLAQQFHRDMLKRYRETSQVLGQPASGPLRTLADLGGVEAARRVVGTAHASDTFTGLWKLGRLDIAVENLVVLVRYRELFEPSLVDLATDRLAAYGLV